MSTPHPVRRPRSRASVLAQAGFGAVAALLLAGTASAAAAPGEPADDHGHHAEPVTTSGEDLVDVVQQAVAAGGTREGGAENSLDLSAQEIAAAAEEVPGDGRPAPVVQGPTDLDPRVAGEWEHRAVRVPEAVTAPGAASAPGAIHTVLLATGKVLVVAGSGNQWMNLQGSSFTTWLWDPSVEDEAAAWRQVETPWDVFCAGHTTLPNGDVLVNGGTAAYPVYDDATGQLLHDWDGSRRSYVFDVSEEEYVRVEDMDAARWYPTTLTLGDGSALTVGGLSDEARALGVVSHNTDLVERFDPETRTWAQAPRMNFTTTDPSVPTAAAGPNETRTFPYYPGLTLLEDGRIFYSGASNGANGIMPGIWDWRTGDFENVDRIPLPYQRNSAATVLLPPAQDQKVMVMGGGDWSEPTTADTQVIDLKDGAGPWTPGPPLTAAKMYVGAVILPDSTVFETNGAARFREGGVRTAGVYDPEAGTMTEMNSPVVDRLYHSEAFLLPDGRVAALGSQPLDGTMDLDISIFTPTYLTSGAQRPVVSGPETVFGADPLAFDVELAEGTTLEGAALLRPSATTHSTDPDQRLVDLVVTRTGDGGYTFGAPTNRDLLPPGQYMLVVTDSAGTPSEAVWVSVDAPTTSAVDADPEVPGGGTDVPAPDGEEEPAAGPRVDWTMTGWEARLTVAAGAPGRDVHLEELVDGEWRFLTNDVAGPDGTVTMTWGGGGRATLRARPLGGAAPSEPFLVVYGPGPTSGSTAAPAPAARTLALAHEMSGWEARFTATSSVAAAGQDVVLEQLVDGAWTRATNAPTGADGATPPMVWGGGGTRSFRATLPAQDGLPAVASPVVVVTYGP